METVRRYSKEVQSGAGVTVILSKCDVGVTAVWLSG